MSLEKPWEEAFDLLLEELIQRYTGSIKKVKNTEEGVRAFEPTASYIFYPTFSGSFNDNQFSITISNFPVLGVNILESLDNIEYLRITIDRKTPYNLQISHESMMDKIQKKFGLISDFEIGKPEFDKKYLITVKSEVDKWKIQEQQFQEIIKGLEPFSSIYISSDNIQWSQEIKDINHFNHVEIESILNKLIALPV